MSFKCAGACRTSRFLSAAPDACLRADDDRTAGPVGRRRREQLFWRHEIRRIDLRPITMGRRIRLGTRTVWVCACRHVPPLLACALAGRDARSRAGQRPSRRGSAINLVERLDHQIGASVAQELRIVGRAMPRAALPPALAAAIPETASSTTKHVCGGRPRVACCSEEDLGMGLALLEQPA